MRRASSGRCRRAPSAPSWSSATRNCARRAFHQFYAEFTRPLLHARLVAGPLRPRRCLLRPRPQLPLRAGSRALSRRRAGRPFTTTSSPPCGPISAPLFRYFELRRRVLEAGRDPPLRHLRAHGVRSSKRTPRFDEAIDIVLAVARAARRRIRCGARRGPARPALVRPLREQGQALRRVFLELLRQSRPSS